MGDHSNPLYVHQYRKIQKVKLSFAVLQFKEYPVIKALNDCLGKTGAEMATYRQNKPRGPISEKFIMQSIYFVCVIILTPSIYYVHFDLHKKFHDGVDNGAQLDGKKGNINQI